MARVARYESQVATQVTSGARAQSVAPGAFGGAIGKGLTNLASGLGEMQQRLDVTAAEEASVKFERDKNDLLFNPKTGYYNTQGRNAMDASDGTSKSLDELKTRYMDSLESEGARSAFGKVADAQILASQRGIMRHASTNAKAWEVSTQEAQVENSLEGATLYWNDPDALRVQLGVGRAALLESAKLQGISDIATNEKLQTYESSFHAASVQAATAHSSAKGRELLEQNRDVMEGPDVIKLEGVIAKKEKAEKTQFEATTSMATATNLVGTYETRADIQEQVNKIEDLELRKKTMSAAMTMYSQKKAAESEAQVAAFEEAEDHVAEGGNVATFQAQNPEAWERLSGKQQRTLQSGKGVVTDMNLYTDLILLPKQQLAKINPNDYAHKLAPTERKSLASAVKVARGTGSSSDKVDSQVGRTRSAQTTSAIEQLIGKKKSKWGTKAVEQSNAFYSLVDDEVLFREEQKGSKLTSTEYTELLGEVTRKVVQSGSLWDSETDITEVEAQELPSLGRFLREAGQPVTAESLVTLQDDLTELRGYLERNNIPTTTENLLEAYRQAAN